MPTPPKGLASSRCDGIEWHFDGPNSQMEGVARISVAGHYDTTYRFDIHAFASKVATIGKLLSILSAAFSGNVTCGTQTTPTDQLICVVVTMVAQNIHPPAWVQTLLTVLSDLFKFGRV